MYDTIGSFVSTNDRINQDCLINLNEYPNKYTGEPNVYGKLGNLKIKQVNGEVGFIGSLAKYYLGNSLRTLTRQSTERAFEKISDELCIKLKNARVYRLDIAGNFIMKNPYKEYLIYFGDCNYLPKSYWKDSAYYTNSKRQLIFYDKPKEMKNKKIEIPEEFLEYKGRILRYELRLLKRVKDQLGKVVLLSDLYDEEFYIKVLNIWKDSYFAINKINSLNLSKMKDATCKDFKNFLLSNFIQEKGLDQIFKIIDSNRGKFIRTEEASRLKADLKKIRNNNKYSDNNELMIELDEKVIKAVKYYR